MRGSEVCAQPWLGLPARKALAAAGLQLSERTIDVLQHEAPAVADILIQASQTLDQAGRVLAPVPAVVCRPLIIVEQAQSTVDRLGVSTLEHQAARAAYQRVVDGLVARRTSQWVVLGLGLSGGLLGALLTIRSSASSRPR